jgi:hypothetical protein
MYTFKLGLLKFSVNSFRLNRITITHYLDQIKILTILDYLRCYNGNLPDLAPIIIELGKNHSIFIKTLSSKRFLSTLLNQLKLVYGPFWTEQHAQLLCDQPGKKRIYQY